MSGDYYMFDELDDEQLDIMEQEQKDDEEEDSGGLKQRKKYTVGEVCRHLKLFVTINRIIEMNFFMVNRF